MKKFVVGAIAIALLLGTGAVYAYVSPLLSKGEPLQAISVSTGLDYACAITASGGAMCWGSGKTYGDFGDGTLTADKRATPVAGLLEGVTDLSAKGSFYACAVHHGAAKCWGSNLFGQLGDGTKTSSAAPVQVFGLESGVTAVSAGDDYACAVQNGGVKCWGAAGMDPKLGDGAEENSIVPVQVHKLTSGIVDVAVGSFHACALTAQGEVGCWGRGGGILGDGSKAATNYPAKPVGLPDRVVAISAAGNTTCVVTEGGAAYCWGSSNYGQLGTGTTNNSAVPVPVFGLTSGVASISVAHSHACAVMAADSRISRNAKVRCWGENQFGQFGNGSTAGSFIPVPSNEPAISVSAGAFDTCAIVERIVEVNNEVVEGSFAKCWTNEFGDDLVAIK